MERKWVRNGGDTKPAIRLSALRPSFLALFPIRPIIRRFLGNDHIVLASGRDYADVSPIDGVIVGSGGQKLSVSVDVAPAVAEETHARQASR